MDLILIAWTACIILASAFLQSLAGFGFSLLAVPMLTLLYPMKTVAPSLAVLCLVLNGMVVRECRRDLELKTLWPLLIAGALFTPLGGYLLLVVRDAWLRACVGGVTAVFAFALLRGLRFAVRQEKYWLFPIGMLSGVLNGSITVSGPPVILFLQNQGKTKMSFRGKLAAYFFALNIVSLLTYAGLGLLDFAVFELSAVASLPLVLGVLGGIRLARGIDETIFKRVVLYTIIATGMVALISGASSL